MNVRHFLVLAALVPSAAAAADDPAWYVRTGTWQETMFASQEALAKHRAAEADPQAAGGGKVRLGPWYTTAPMKAPKELQTVLPPEQGDDPATPAAGGKVRWTKRPGWQDGVIQHLGGGKNVIVYAFRTLAAAEACRLTVYVGCDDHMMIFLNGRNVHTCTKRHGVRPNEHTLALSLRAGENKLLMKVRDVGGVHAMYFSTSPAPRAGGGPQDGDLWTLLLRGFADERSVRQMQWEQADRIWEIEWDDKAASRLAGRYLRAASATADAPSQDLPAARDLYYRAKRLAAVRDQVRSINLPALRRAIEHLTRTFPQGYGRRGFLQRLEELEASLPAVLKDLEGGGAAAADRAAKLAAFQREALLANPLLDFDRLLLVRRDARAPRLALPANWQGNTDLPRNPYHDEIVVLSPVSPAGRLTTLFRPARPAFLTDVDLHFDADRLLFSLRADSGRWQLWETDLAGSAPRQLTPGDQPDVDNFDGCYLPDGNIVYSSTACMQGVPCVQGSSHVANLFLLDGKTGKVRQLCFDQDHNWCPAVLPTGRVLYLRWEYSDIPHAFSRILFHMNPDGTGQMEYYGSNSYWPNSLFYARPCPGAPTKFVGIVTGHHGVARVGEMVLFDHARGRYEADGALQRIGGWGKPVEPVLRDHLVDASWPKFLHPWPLSDGYFLVSAQETPKSNWCVYLVDVFDNMLKLCEVPGSALLEPVPLRPRPRPPVIPERVDPSRKDAMVYLTDVYAGPGLAGVPRGTIRNLRLFTYHFAYRGMGAQQDRVGLDGPWDIKRVLGTVPVEADGSAAFRVPANTPISIQPLDELGQAVQRMRSWFTAMPGEQVSCVGCHERQADAPAGAPQPAAFAREPSEIQPWYGPVRGFGFRREVQPVLDRHCVRCHAKAKASAPFPLVDGPDVVVHPIKGQHGMGRFSPSYYALRRFVRSPTIESDLHLLPAWEFHAESTKLVQMLRKGHHGVRLDAESWDRIVTWIDLHTPAHGTWTETVGTQRVAAQRDRRQAMRKLYAGIEEDPEAIPEAKIQAREGGPDPEDPDPRIGIRGLPRQECARFDASGVGQEKTIDLGQGVTMTLVSVPAGEFVMGDPNGHPDELPLSRVKIGQAFWMGACEVTNEQFARFDPAHDSRLEHGNFLQFSQRERGYPLNGPRQPVVRVSWHEAMAFCRWLSGRTGERFTLPAETQWEYACRAGTATPMSYGAADADHAKFANLADASVKQMESLGWGLPYGAIPPWHPTDGRFNDGARVSADVGSYRPSAWGLYDMHGNVCEWTRSDWGPYPRREGDSRVDGPPAALRKVVRGGSWYDRPQHARSAFRLSYRPCQTVYDVGFRVVCEPPPVRAAE